MTVTAAAIIGGAAVVGAGITAYSANRGTRAQTAAANASNDIEREQYNQNRADLAPWRAAGGSALNALNFGLGFSGATNPYGGSGGAAMPVGKMQPDISGLGAAGQYRYGGSGPLSGGDTLTLAKQGDGTYGLGGADLPLGDPTGSRSYGLSTVGQSAPSNPGATSGFGDLNRDFTLADFQRDPGAQFRLEQGEQALQRGASARGLNLSGATLKALDRYNSGQAAQEYQSAYERFNADRSARFNRLASVAGLGQTATSQGVAAGQAYANGVSNNYAALGNAQAANSIATGNAINGAVTNGVSAYQNYQLLNSLKKTG